MKPVCVITGGGSGMGRATAKLVCEAGYHVILVGRTAAKLESAVAELTEAGHEAEAFACDLSDRASCEKLARHAVERGQVKALLHIAGMSPHMGSPEAILRANALGTVNINDAFYPVMAPGGCVIDTASMSAYLAPGNFDTPMGQLESAEAQTFTAHSALKRNGRPEEIAALYALLLDERLGYLTGTDIVMDGGVIASGVSGLSR